MFQSASDAEKLVLVEETSDINPEDEDALLTHIKTSHLDLEMFGEVDRSGNFWYTTNYNLSVHHGICPEGVNNAHDLREKVVNSLEFHPSFATSENASSEEVSYNQ